MVDDSLRTPHPPAAARRAAGKAVRKRVPRNAHADWSPPASRPDPVDWMRMTSEGRLPDYVGVRVGRMVVSPFTFLRGAADLMAQDLVGTPHSGTYTTLIGDAHLANFGFYASPERHLMLDVNDFDQAAPGPWEWDLKRLAASLVVAARHNGLSDGIGKKAVEESIGAYAEAIDAAAREGTLPFNLDVFTVDRLRKIARKTAISDEVDLAEAKARRKTHASTMPKFTGRGESGELRMIDAPPLMVDVFDSEPAVVGATEDQIVDALDEYVETLPYNWQRVLRSYTFRDSAYRVTGVGSAGMRSYVALLTGMDDDDAVFLQLKEAGPSVLDGRADGPVSRHAHNGRRVVAYQQRSQAASDPLLGWTSMDGRDFYVRQLRDMKGDIPTESLDAIEMPLYGRLCGALLARAHARAGDAAAVSGYLGGGGALGESIAEFAVKYADQTEADWQAVSDAALAGDLPYVPDER
ncbi:MAG: hypothetical protein RLZ55_727 [Actinomycetota bacterium]